MTNVTISTSISQTFLSWVTKCHLRQPMVFLSHSSYGMPGLAPLMNVLFWEWRNFHVSFSGRDMSGNVWNRPSGSSMVDMGILSNITKSPSLKCYMTFWDMIIYSDIFHWSDILLNRDLVTEFDLWPFFDVISLFREVSIGHLERVRLANRWRLLLWTPCPVPFGLSFVLMLRPLFSELFMSTDLLSFEHTSVLLFSCNLHMKLYDISIQGRKDATKIVRCFYV